MARKGYSEEQIGVALRQADAGTPVGEICRKLGISEPTFYRWKRKFAGLGISEIRRLKQLEDDGDGIQLLDTHRHNTQVTLGGVTLARTVEIINGYQIEFEDGHVTMASPIGRAMLGKKKGEVAMLKLPARTRKLKIVELVTIHQAEPDDLD